MCRRFRWPGVVCYDCGRGLGLPHVVNAGAGISSQVRPSSRRPCCFLRTPPHCLKKKGRRWR